MAKVVPGRCGDDFHKETLPWIPLKNYNEKDLFRGPGEGLSFTSEGQKTYTVYIL